MAIPGAMLSSVHPTWALATPTSHPGVQHLGSEHRGTATRVQTFGTQTQPRMRTLPHRRLQEGLKGVPACSSTPGLADRGPPRMSSH